MKPNVIGFYGKSNTGKTTLIVEIIKFLSKEGFKIASVKISDKKISIDSTEKDTWRHGEAGSKLVVLSSQNETDFILKQHMTNIEIVNHIYNLGDYDIIIVEGANDDNIPKIRIGNIKKRNNTIMDYDNDFEKLIDYIKNNISRRN